MRHSAGGYGAVMNDIAVKADLLHDLPRESKWVGASQDIPSTTRPRPGCAHHIVEGAGAGPDVVSAMAGFNVLVVGTSVQDHVAGSSYQACAGVIGRLVGEDYVVTIVQLHITSGLVDVSGFLLLGGTDRGGLSRDWRGS